MKNIPSIGNNAPIPQTVLNTVEKVASSAQKVSNAVTEASIVSLPKAKPAVGNDQGVDKVLNSFLSGLDEAGLEAAHSGLDPSRVADLLSDD